MITFHKNSGKGKASQPEKCSQETFLGQLEIEAESDSGNIVDDDQSMGDTLLKILLHPEPDLVENIVSYLLYWDDVIALSEASKGALQSIRDTKQFSSRSRVRISEPALQSALLREKPFHWKHLKIFMDFDPNLFVSAVDEKLDSVESVYFHLPPNFPPSGLETSSFLEGILGKAPNLKVLGLQAEILGMDLNNFRSNIEIQQRLALGDIQSLDIFAREEENVNRRESISFEEGQSEEFQKSCLHLANIPLQLKRLSVANVGNEQVKSIPQILSSNQETLAELQLYFNIWQLHEMAGIQFPKLRSLSLSIYGWVEEDENVFTTFLRNQPPLEELDLSLKILFPVGILQALQQSGLNKMKRFHLKAKRFHNQNHMWDPMDWQFLERMTELRDFSLKKPKHRIKPMEAFYGHGEDILKALGRSLKLEKIHIQGIPSFWMEGSLLERNVGRLIFQFRKLTELNLSRCPGAVTDEGLQSIISNFPNLTFLSFSHCSEVTDFGITGVSLDASDKKGASLMDLKRLRYLKIRSCPNVTPSGMLKAVKFPFLRHFDFCQRLPLPKVFLYQIVRQNPRLETVALHIINDIRDFRTVDEIRREVRKISGRTQFVELKVRRGRMDRRAQDLDDMDSDSDASEPEDTGNDDNE